MERRLEFKLGQLFKIVHNLCFSLERFLNLGSKQLFSGIQVLFIRYVFINRELIYTNSYKYSFVPRTIMLWNYLTFELVSTSSFFYFF